MFSHDIERALHAAQTAHSGQTRKGSQKPYIVHPMHVALLLARAGADEVTVQAGILHDVVEDCEEWTLERLEVEFGVEVRGLVAQLTEDKSKTWPERKQAAIDHVPEMTQAAATIKAADKLHNLSSLLHDLRAAEDPEAVWAHFTASAPETLAMARGLVEALLHRVERGLGKVLLGTLEALEHECDRA